MAELSPITVARFWSKVSVVSITKCWLWTGAIKSDGYGNFRVPELGRRMQQAHRVAYTLANGVWPPDDLVVRHKCDCRPCVNPRHLLIGTQRDNMQDMIARNRRTAPDQRGALNYAAKLSADDVAKVREMFDLKMTNIAIAAQFGVTHAAISKIRTGAAWAPAE